MAHDTYWTCYGRRCRHGTCDTCSRQQLVDGVEKNVFACSDRKCLECTCPVLSTTTGGNRGVRRSGMSASLSNRSIEPRRRVSKRKRTATQSLNPEVFKMNGEGIDDASDKDTAESHLKLSSSIATVDELRVVFDSAPVNTAISNFTKTQNQELQSGSITDSSRALNRAKNVLKTSIACVSRILNPSNPNMVLEALHEEMLSNVKSRDNKLATTVTAAYKVHERKVGTTTKRILRGLLSGSYSRHILEL